MVCVVATSARTASAVLREGIFSVRDPGRRGSHRRDRFRHRRPTGTRTPVRGLLPHSCLPWTKGSQTHRLTGERGSSPRHVRAESAPSPRLPALVRRLAFSVRDAAADCPHTGCIFWCWKRSPLATLFRERPIACSCQRQIVGIRGTRWPAPLRFGKPCGLRALDRVVWRSLAHGRHRHGQFTSPGSVATMVQPPG